MGLNAKQGNEDRIQAFCNLIAPFPYYFVDFSHRALIRATALRPFDIGMLSI